MVVNSARGIKKEVHQRDIQVIHRVAAIMIDIGIEIEDHQECTREDKEDNTKMLIEDNDLVAMTDVNTEKKNILEMIGINKEETMLRNSQEAADTMIKEGIEMTERISMLTTQEKKIAETEGIIKTIGETIQASMTRIEEEPMNALLLDRANIRIRNKETDILKIQKDIKKM